MSADDMSATDEAAAKYPEILEDLRGKLSGLLEESGIDIARSREIAFKFAEIVRRDWGGQKIYIPSGQSYEVSKRDLEIFRRFTGRNGVELCREYRISDTYLRTVIARVRDVAVKRRQGGLF